jgi:hypothetical protein
MPLREFVIQTAADPTHLAESARSKLWSIDSNVPIYRVETMTNVLERSLGVCGFNRNVISIFSLVALVLAADTNVVVSVKRPNQTAKTRNILVKH